MWSNRVVTIVILNNVFVVALNIRAAKPRAAKEG